ncbi:MAG: shikimate dehydrogenase [Armatimonadetes bacterium]|nr:shikimate dehydrogenase [Armatimonadota bacterium]
MNRFAFIIHALDVKDVARKYPVARYLPSFVVEALLSLMQPKPVSHIRGVVSATGAQTEGWFIGCPRTSAQLLRDQDAALRVVIRAAQIAEELGASVVGLGAYTSIIGNGGKEVADAVDIAVTTGNSYTVFTAVEGALKAAQLMGIDPSQATAAVLGATGSIGRACALLLADRVARIRLAARTIARLAHVAEEVRGAGSAAVSAHSDLAAAMQDADLIIAVTSALDAVVEPEHLKPGAVVCDVARPRDVSRRVAEERDDVLVIEGGIVQVPGDVDFGFDFGFPPKTAYACMAETMILALEGFTEDYSIGRELELEKVRHIGALAEKHGFRLAGFRSFERPISDEEIARIRERAEQKRKGG